MLLAAGVLPLGCLSPADRPPSRRSGTSRSAPARSPVRNTTTTAPRRTEARPPSPPSSPNLSPPDQADASLDRPAATPPEDPPKQPATTVVEPKATPGTSSGGYEVTVYYTAVESFHADPKVAVTGCQIRECAHGSASLGSYPESFVLAVKQEGTGRITSGAQAGRYLNWSYDVGYWLDDVAVDSYGGQLVPFSSSAADGLARGFRFRLVGPLLDDSGATLDPGAAARLTGSIWTISDQFTPGLGGARHVDLYIGEEDRPSFESTSPLYTTLHDVRLTTM